MYVCLFARFYLSKYNCTYLLFMSVYIFVCMYENECIASLFKSYRLSRLSNFTGALKRTLSTHFFKSDKS
jgi:hypothetical protein